MDNFFEREFSEYSLKEKNNVNVLNPSFITFLDNLPDNFIDKKYVPIFFNRINFISEKRKDRIVTLNSVRVYREQYNFTPEEVVFQLKTFKDLL